MGAQGLRLPLALSPRQRVIGEFKPARLPVVVGCRFGRAWNRVFAIREEEDISQRGSLRNRLRGI